MSLTLDEYEREYRGHLHAAEGKCGAAERAGTDAERRAAVGAADRALEAAKDTVQLMELEGRSLSGVARTGLQATLRACRDELAALKSRLKELRAARTPQQADRIREDLFSGSDRYRDSPQPGERSRMLANNERLAHGTERLKDAHAVTLDMESTANSILGDLAQQRETLMHSQGTLRYAAEGLDASKRVLRQMARRAAMNKCTLYAVIGVMLLLILMTLWSGTAGADGAPPPAAKGADGAEWQKTGR